MLHDDKRARLNGLIESILGDDDRTLRDGEALRVPIRIIDNAAILQADAIANGPYAVDYNAWRKDRSAGPGEAGGQIDYNAWRNSPPLNPAGR